MPEDTEATAEEKTTETASQDDESGDEGDVVVDVIVGDDDDEDEDDDEDDEDDDEEEEGEAEAKPKPVVVAPVVTAPVRPQPGRPPSAREEPPPPFATGERIILIQNTRPRTGSPIGNQPVGATGKVETVLSQTAIVRFDSAPEIKEVVAFVCLKTAETPERAAQLLRAMLEPRIALQERTGRPASAPETNGAPASAASPSPAPVPSPPAAKPAA
ncbi:MAG: hypothetical protein ACREN2_00675, partial [Candidatus Dormibacteria bacterium]